VVKAYRSKKLRFVPSGKAVDYYVNFNASGPNDINAAKGRFILISIKGQMFVSDGVEVWDENADCDLALQMPVRWKRIPASALVVKR
jgi:hypothetical protein